MTRVIWMIALIAVLVMAPGCPAEDPQDCVYPDTSRESKIPAGQVKITPETDAHPPLLHSDEYEEPVPLPYPINTAGAEDSGFITPDGNTLYIWFTPDVDVPPEKQLLDDVTGVYVSRKVNGEWQQPELIISRFAAEPSLDSEGNIYFTHHFFRDGIMLEADLYVAYRKTDGA